MILTSDRPIISEVLNGHCWVGADLIIGTEGLDSFQKQGNRSNLIGLDGYYTVVMQDGADWLVGADSKGMVPLFAYRSGEHWGIADSFYGLVKAVRAKNWPLTLNESVLGAFHSRRTFTDQLSTYRTQFDEIELMPTYTHARVGNGKLQLISRPKIHPAISYSESLFEYIRTWRDRLSTILQYKPESFRFDLSGGIDSRTVLAFGLSFGSSFTRSNETWVYSNPRKTDDFRVAANLAQEFGFEISEPTGRKQPHCKSEDIFDSWKQHSLGVYLPVYIHGGVLDPNYQIAYGAGGECFRNDFYSGDDENRQIRSASLSMKPEFLEEWADEVRITASRLSAYAPNVPVLLTHYREFRNRLHTGHIPRHALTYSPLQSIVTESLTDFDFGKDPRQLYFDIMVSLAPRLVETAFDRPEKSPTPRILQNLTKVDIVEPTSGNVYGHSSYEYETVPNDSPLRWMDEARNALGLSEVQFFLSEESFDAATRTLTHWDETGKFTHAHEFGLKSLSHALTAKFSLGF